MSVLVWATVLQLFSSAWVRHGIGTGLLPRPALRSPVLPLLSVDRAIPDSVQTEAICSTDKSILVVASAGTGKTRVLRTRMAYLLLKKQVPASQILAVTFTQHAAEQLEVRVGAVAGEALKGAWLG